MPRQTPTHGLGLHPGSSTPFDQEGALDLSAFARLCERQIEAHVPAFVVGETTGEAATLTPAERDQLIRTAVETARGSVRVIAGAGSNDTVRAIELTRLAEAAGADAVVSVVPYYNKSMQAGIEAHFRAVADATALPVILHDTTPSLRMTDGLLRVLVCPHLVTSLNG